ncbi:hypothetical protein LJR042_002860 [Microbacterium maritypicum]
MAHVNDSGRQYVHARSASAKRAAPGGGRKDAGDDAIQNDGGRVVVQGRHDHDVPVTEE